MRMKTLQGLQGGEEKVLPSWPADLHQDSPLASGHHHGGGLSCGLTTVVWCDGYIDNHNITTKNVRDFKRRAFDFDEEFYFS